MRNKKMINIRLDINEIETGNNAQAWLARIMGGGSQR